MAEGIDRSATRTRQQARLIIEDVSPIAIRAAMDAVPAWGSDTARTLLNAPQRSLYHVGNFGLRLACELSATEPVLARELYERFSGRSIYLNIVYGPEGIPLEAFCAWGAADNADWEAVRRARLDKAATDDKLAVEVLTALLQGRSAFLEQYAAELLARAEPVAIARGLMVLGFGEPSEFGANTIAKYEKIGGFIGTAAEQARYAYERNVWSRHWYRLMGDANSAEDYWRWSVLLRKIVDGRFSLWERTEQKDIGPAALFDASLEAGIKKRIKGWKSKREKTLLGHKVPASVFLPKK